MTPSVPGGDGESRPVPVGGSAAEPSGSFVLAPNASMPFVPDVMSNLRAYRARPGTCASFKRIFLDHACSDRP